MDFGELFTAPTLSKMLSHADLTDQKAAAEAATGLCDFDKWSQCEAN